MKAGRAAEAEPLLRRALALAQRPPRDPRGLAESLRASSQVHMHAGDDTLERARKRFGENHRYFGFALAAWSEFLLADGRIAESLIAAERAVAVVRAALPADSWRIGEVESTLGACLAAAGRSATAEETLLVSLDKLERRPRPRLGRQTAQRLIALYTATGRSRQADALRRRLQIDS